MPCAPEVCATSWPGAPGAGVGQPGHERAQHVVGHGQQHEVGRGDHLVGGQDGHAGQHALGPLARLRRHPAGGDDLVPGPRQRGPERAADPSGADDADAQPRGSRCAQQQSLRSAPERLRAYCRPFRGPPGPVHSERRQARAPNQELRHE